MNFEHDGTKSLIKIDPEVSKNVYTLISHNFG